MKENTESTLSTGKQPESVSKTENNRYHSQTLFCGLKEIVIEHSGQTYRLQITRQNKLILTK